MSTPRVFISYSQSDIDWVKKFADTLRVAGIPVFFAAEEIPVGEPIGDALEKGLRESDVITAIVAPGNTRSPGVLFELGAAIALGKRVISIVPDNFDTSKLPSSLRMRKYLTKQDPEVTAQQLAEVLKAGVEHKNSVNL